MKDYNNIRSLRDEIVIIFYFLFIFSSTLSFRIYNNIERKNIMFQWSNNFKVLYKVDSYQSDIENIPVIYSNNNSSSSKNYNYYQKFKKAKYNPTKRQLRSNSPQELINPIDPSKTMVANNMPDILRLAQQGSIKPAFLSFMRIYSHNNTDSKGIPSLQLVDCNMVFMIRTTVTIIINYFY